MWQRQAIKSDELPLAEWRRYIDMALDYPIENVELFGGDVLLRKDILLPLIHHIKSKNLKSNIFTNGNLLDETTARRLVDSGVDEIYISMDGIGRVHDEVRGVEGSFRCVEKGIDYLLRARNGHKNPTLIVSCTISQYNIDSFEETLDFCLEKGIDQVVYENAIQIPVSSADLSEIEGVKPFPYYTRSDSQFLLDMSSAKLLKKKIREMKTKWKADSAVRNRFSTSQIDILKLNNLVRGESFKGRCYLCRFLVVIDPYGNILPCPFFDSYSLGNIQRENLSRIWNNSKHAKFVRSRDKKKLEICKYCALDVGKNVSLINGLRKAFFSVSGLGLDEN